ncbi:MAG: GNAT family N-acetyltransferase [Erysipelotrichaceae bacterium]|nr:GNAT family N-acetyltransferase [Erysipelotrichaceae bacterium]
MNLNIFDKAISIFISILALIIGILFVINYENFWFFIYITLIIFFTLSLIKNIKTKNYKPLIINLIAIIILIFYKYFYYNLIHVLFGWWIIINGFISFIEYYIARRDMLPNAISHFIMTILNLVIGMLIITSVINSPIILSNLIGAYLIITSSFNLGYYILNLLPISISQRFSISMPIIFSIIFPSQIYVSMDKLIKKKEILPNTKVSNKGVDVLIHIKDYGTESVGHVDIAVDNYIYSYGLHDPKTRALFGTFGDGVLFKLNKEISLNHSVHQEDKMIIMFNLNISDTQKEIIENKLENLLKDAYEWKPEAQYLFENNKPNNKSFDYASRVYKFTDAKMYKFKKEKFKTYFAATTNCVLLSDYLIRSKGINLIRLNGIVTPGTYLQFLVSESIKDNSIVNKVSIYTHHNLKDGFILYTFNGLKRKEDYRIVRKQVFIDEQNFKVDIDEIDEYSTHAVIFDKEKPVATGRVYQDETGLVHIGRICVLKEYRKHKLASIIMKELEIIGFAWNDTITLSSQVSAQGFYSKLGYKPHGEVYFDEWCEHIDMYKKRV